MQLHAPCCTGWGFESDQTMAIAKLAIETGLLSELRDGGWRGHEGEKGCQETGRGILKDPERFRHLFKPTRQDADIAAIQAIADKNAAKYGIDIKLKKE